MAITKKRILVGWLLAISMIGVAPETARAQLAKNVDLTVFRNGSPIGSERMRVESKGDDTTVSSTTDLKVTLGPVPLYRFHQTTNEHWRANQLISMTTETDDNGTLAKLELVRQADRLVGNGNGKPLSLADPVAPASLWTVELTKYLRFFRNSDGSILELSVDNLGPSSLKSQGRSIAAHHYRISGALTEDIWFREDGLLVRLEMTAKDGSNIVFAAQ